MKIYGPDAIRNVAFVGHGASGKTTLVDALGFVSGSSRRHGSIKDGSTLTDTSPTPKVSVPPGGHLVVTVPRWGWGTATDVHPARRGILREQCTVLLPGHGRCTIFLAARPGSTRLGATVQPASNLMMPAWGGTAIVRPARG